ncbi:hypothetical protein M3196_10145 [Fictibacillus nanhaiensis]|uniref:hypothetical protein n=1 Tax=Fictibacillus nanhaiensis TaxID=742169 RepID=UPI00203D19B0|nr:hypothetical protein [Fictibacillus nanhaiensis]MCM3732019.1 hypothetical protein [Fictibacillus nanhaiensis]
MDQIIKIFSNIPTEKILSISVLLLVLGVFLNLIIFRMKNKSRKEYDRSISQIYLVNILITLLETEKDIYNSINQINISQTEKDSLSLLLLDCFKLKDSEVVKIESTFYTEEQKALVKTFHGWLIETLEFQEWLSSEIQKIDSVQYKNQLLEACSPRIQLVDVMLHRSKLVIIRLQFEKDFSDLKSKETDTLDSLFKTGLNK